MLNKHVISLKRDSDMNPFPCYNCISSPQTERNGDCGKMDIENKGLDTFPSCEEYVTHLLNDHEEVSEKQLVAMRRRRFTRKSLTDKKVRKLEKKRWHNRP